jgi:hypothetical protein
MSPKHVAGDTRTHSSFDHRPLTIVCTASYIAQPHARALLDNLHSGYIFPGVGPGQRNLNDYGFQLNKSPKDQGDLISPRETHPFRQGLNRGNSSSA